MKMMFSCKYKRDTLSRASFLTADYNFFSITVVLLLKFCLNRSLIWWCNYVFNVKWNWDEIVPHVKEKKAACHFDRRIKSHFLSPHFPSLFFMFTPPVFGDSSYLDSAVYFHTILCQPWQLLKWQVEKNAFAHRAWLISHFISVQLVKFSLLYKHPRFSYTVSSLHLTSLY